MFSGLLSVRLRAAEKALREGRLDEAYRLATAPDIREHGRGVKVLEALSERFIRRAREHFDADRFAEALLDLERAEAGQRHQQRIAELREQIRTVASEEVRKQRSRHERLAAAKQRIARGSLQAGKHVLEEAASNDPEAQNLRRKAEQKEAHAGQMFDEVERLVKQRQWAAAIERLRQARALQPHAPAAASLESTICTALIGRARDALEQGRPARAEDELRGLGEFGAALPERREIEDALRLIHTAGAALAAFRVDDARQAVLRLENLLPKAKWAHRAADDLKAMDDKLMSLCGGPLGEQLAGSPASAVAQAKPRDLAETVLVRGPAPSADALPECLLILIDGGGSYLLHRGDRVSVGRAAAAHPADIPIFSDLAERHADLARVEDDYFIFCPRDVQVNGVVVKQRLMQDGDRVTLGRRARFTFRLPSRRSASATLDMSDRSKLPRDVRRVILFRGNAMIGNGPAAHLTCSTAVRPLVLFERAGQLWVRSQDRRGPAAEAQPVQIGESMDVEDVSFVVQPWTTGQTGV